jgi:hypothetical protein
MDATASEIPKSRTRRARRTRRRARRKARTPIGRRKATRGARTTRKEE